MKNLIFATLLLGAPAFASESLVELTEFPGFTRMPKLVELKVMDSGDVTMIVTDLRTKKVATATIAALSAGVVERVKAAIEQIPVDAKLIDPHPNLPKCTDAPSSEVKVKRANATQQTIQTWAGCHTSKTESYYALDLVNLVDSLLALAPPVHQD